MRKIYIAAAIMFFVLVGISVALTPPPPPPPPVPQNLGLGDRGIDQAVTNATDQSACRVCHQTSGTNISGGYSNTIGGVPTRHHLLVQRQITNPITGALFGCNDCHPSTPGIGNGILLDRSCVDCHNGTAFSNLGARVGNFSRPHHVNTSYASSNIGNPVAARQCNFCHGSFLNSYNDNHYKPTYDVDFMITPWASFKATNTSQPDGLGGSKTWGGCYSCHLADPSASPVIESNHDTHHKEILGLGRFGGKTDYQNASTPGAACYWCHVITPGSTSPLRFNMTNPFTGELLVKSMQVRNSTIENAEVAAGLLEPGTTNITINGTGCEKCHDVKSLHNIQYQYVQNGPQGKGHINNDLDCSGCHDSWLPANTFTPGALVPYVDSVNPSVIAAGTAATLTISGTNFVNDAFSSVVTVDGVTYTPTSVTDSQIVVDISALSTGTHQVQVVKGGDTLSKLSALTVVPAVTLTSATLSGTTLTITGAGLGSMPGATPEMYVTATHAGTVYKADAVTSWSDTQIVATVTAPLATGDVVEVVTADAGASNTPVTVADVPDSVTVTSPNGGENWKRGTQHAITWNRAGSSQAANVKIELLKGTSVYKTITSSTSNSGSYSWTINSGWDTGTSFKIRITSVGHTPTYSDTSDGNFQISR